MEQIKHQVCPTPYGSVRKHDQLEIEANLPETTAAKQNEPQQHTINPLHKTDENFHE
jgi:hypothetical protein